MQLTPGEEAPELSLRGFFRLLLKQFYANSFRQLSVPIVYDKINQKI